MPAYKDKVTGAWRPTILPRGSKRGPSLLNRGLGAGRVRLVAIGNAVFRMPIAAARISEDIRAADGIPVVAGAAHGPGGGIGAAINARPRLKPGLDRGRCRGISAGGKESHDRNEGELHVCG